MEFRKLLSYLWTTITTYLRRYDGNQTTFAVLIWNRINFTMQIQTQSNWCWAAVTSIVSHFFDPASTWTQCAVVNAELNRTDCCMKGSSIQCNRTWYLDRALTRTGNFSKMASVSENMTGIKIEIDKARPLCLRIGWSGGGGHLLAIDGYNTGLSMVAVDDPWYGASDIKLSVLKTAYQGGGTWTHTYWVQP